MTGYSQNGSGLFISVGDPTDNYAAYFYASVLTTGNYLGSDRSLKNNIEDFNSAMDIIGKLQAKQYEYRQDGDYKLMNLPHGKHYGLIAQDLEQVLPNLVKDAKFDVSMAKQIQTVPEPGKAHAVAATQQPDDVIDFKAVNYTELIPILAKGMQELSKENEELKNKNQDLEARLQKVEALLNGSRNTVTSISAYLEQNTPNPVNGTTTIRYHLPENVASALLNITNAEGKLIKTMTLNSGTNQVRMNTSMLASGTYQYSLYVNGNSADTKRLVVAH